jgi:hypothetical protein
MLQKMRVLLLVCITAVLAACGGGGGDDTPNFAGNYRINANLATNSCNLAGLVQVVGGVDTVTQSGRNVTYSSEGINPLQGTVDADNGGYTVTGSQTSSGVTFALTAKYKTSTAYEMKLVANGCTIVYTGTATKI